MEAYIYDALRTVRGKGNRKGSLIGITPTELATQTLVELRERHDLATEHVEDVILGCVGQVMDQAANIAKTAAQQSGYGDHLCGVSLNRFCGSGLEAINQAAAYVKSGFRNVIVAGGVESMSRVKMGSDGGGMFIDPAVAIPGNIVPQGISADLIATLNGFSRDDCDAYAVESQKRAKRAWDEGRFKKSIVPVKDQLGVKILDHDEHMRPQTDMQSLGSLNPAFESLGKVMPGMDYVALQKYPELESIKHVHHAGNSSGIVDGAAAVLVGTKEMGEALGLKARARIKAFAEIGSEPTIMLTGPEFVAAKVLKRAGMDVKDIDIYELNEAFASVVLRFMQAHNIAHDKINVNGGAIAMGHPLGATGAMILGTMVDELERSDKETSLITLCVGGGMGSATIIERV